MAYSVPLLQLQNTIRQRCDIVNNNVVTDSELIQYINDSGTELNDRLVGAFGSGYNLKQQAWSTVANQAFYPFAYVLTFNTGIGAFTAGLVVTGATSGAKGTIVSITGSTASGTLSLASLSGTFIANETITDASTGSAKYASNNGGTGAADFQVLHGLDVQLNGQLYIPVPEYKLSERALYQVPAAFQTVYGTPFGYRIQGAGFILAPTPASVFAMLTYYTPTWSTLVNSTDTVDAIDGWHELIVVDCCIKCLVKQDLDSSPFEQQKMAIIQRIETMKQQRDASAPPRIVNVYDTGERRFSTWGRWGW